jgi:hypothetical protein
MRIVVVGTVGVVGMAGAVSARENEDILLGDVWGGGKVGVEKHVHLTYSCICHLRLSSDPLRGDLEIPQSFQNAIYSATEKFAQPQFYPAIAAS